jgi:hypothetical protein
MRGGDYLGHEVMGCAIRLGQKGDLGRVKRKEKGKSRLCGKKNQWAGFNFLNFVFYYSAKFLRENKFFWGKFYSLIKLIWVTKVRILHMAILG